MKDGLGVCALSVVVSGWVLVAGNEGLPIRFVLIRQRRQIKVCEGGPRFFS